VEKGVFPVLCGILAEQAAELAHFSSKSRHGGGVPGGRKSLGLREACFKELQSGFAPIAAVVSLIVLGEHAGVISEEG